MSVAPARRRASSVPSDCSARATAGISAPVRPSSTTKRQKMLGTVHASQKASEARLVEVVRGGPDEVDPRCTHFGICGGCRLQHLDYAAQIREKGDQVRDALRRLGLEPERMGVAGFGPHQPVAPNLTGEDRQKNRRVELFVMAPEVPVIGWTETTPNLY